MGDDNNSKKRKKGEGFGTVESRFTIDSDVQLNSSKEKIKNKKLDK